MDSKADRNITMSFYTRLSVKFSFKNHQFYKTANENDCDLHKKMVFFVVNLESRSFALTLTMVEFNKYRGGTSDTTSSTLVLVPLFMISVDDFLRSKLAIIVV